MPDFQSTQYWLLLVAVAYIAFRIGRATAGGENTESREVRALRAQESAERVFSELSTSNQTEVDRLLFNDEVIAAVKLIREEAGIGLKDAKGVADHRRRKLAGRQTP